MLEPHIMLQRAEQRDALADQHRYAGDNQAVDQARAEKTLDGDSASTLAMNST